MKTKTYNINGMTCSGCRNSVIQQLTNLAQVASVSVDLDSAIAVITMHDDIPLLQLQSALSDKYQIIDPDHLLSKESNQQQYDSKWQQLAPLFLILGYIIIATTLLNLSRDNWSMAMYDYMGLFFIVFSFFKLLDLKGFPSSFAMYDPLARVVPVYGWVYPFIEIVLGLMFLMRFELTIALIVTLIILSITSIGVISTLLNKKSISCACLGTVLKLPMTEATLIENSIMIIMAVMMLLLH